ncbi:MULTISPECIES: hypothetical protein [Pseudomonas]|uniref:YobI family P-loop NTPase n=1 Tax=Pseudomonas TaxID=286 RepID=UPI000427E758|nr:MULTISPECIES: hypothetical protein [Pseudomonas]MBP1120968.1 hypothetical protein [Pseudomonas sp. PvP028]QWB06886.1 hypothetical protein KLC09_25390 [Pseudomonas syringae]UOF18715.1 hypothetical protein N023_19005 [Pseudomonas syringae CC440]UZA81084.1 hypothetical protein EZZ79_19790 [Pseudomonas syringae]
MSQGWLASIRLKCAAFSVAAKEGIRIFRSLCSAPSSSGTFEPLTPVLIDSDHFDRYERELLGALGKDEVLNIALTGGYGAGKSSVLKTFFERHPEFQTAYVSLATFSKDAPPPSTGSGTEPPETSARNSQSVQDTGEGSTSSDLIARIEETIVQQLLYAVPAARLPKTRLKRIVQTSGRSIARRTIVLGVIFIATMRLYVPTLKEMPTLDPAWLLTSLLTIPGWLSVLVAGLGGFYLLYASLKFLSMFSIDGLTLKGGKLEAVNHGSVLHKNVDEIIYCFERSDVRVVVIEDLDRFGTQGIFFRLREINFTIRNSPQITRPVHFIYAIRDELFTVTDKTKFFDLIIPVIPVVNSENSREKLNELMKIRVVDGKALGADLDPVLVETVCYYIDEMRLIKNIVNEYDIFASLLSHGGLNLDQNKLFAIVVLRNLYPEEFAELVKRRGKVYNLLTGLSSWADQPSQALAELERLIKEKSQREEHGEERIIDLRLSVWFEVLRASGIDSANYVLVDGNQRVSLNEFLQDEVFTRVCEAEQLKGMLFSQWANHNPIGHVVRPDDALERASYRTRLAWIHHSLKSLEGAIGAAERKLTEIKTISFREAARGEYGMIIEQRLVGMEMVVYLMRAGYLDTDYTDYLGFFYEGSLTRGDQNLILALRRRTSLDVASPVRNPERVAGKLEHDALGDGKGIIVDLIVELSLSAPLTDLSDARTQKLDIILQSGHQNTSRLAEAVSIILAGDAWLPLVRAVYALAPDLFTVILSSERFTEADARQTLICGMMDSLSQQQLEVFAHRKPLLNTIASLIDIDHLIAGMESSINGWAWLRREPVHFNNLAADVGSSILGQLIGWGCLQLSLPMMALILKTFTGEGGDVSYKRLRALSLAGLDSLIETAPEDFIFELMKQPSKLQENTESLRYILGLVQDDQEVQEDLFRHTEGLIDDLEGFTANIWEKVLELDRVTSVAQAAWSYYIGMIVRPTETPSQSIDKEEQDRIRDIFTAFLARNAREAQRLWDDVRDEADDLKAYLLASELDDDSLDEIFGSTTVGPESLAGLNISADRWGFLAQAHFVPFDGQVLEEISNNAPTAEAAYLIRCWADARDYVDLRKFDPKAVGLISDARSVPIGDIAEMWEGLVAREEASHAAVVGKLALVCARANAENFIMPRNCRNIIASRACDANLPQREKQELLHQALKLHIDWATTSSILVSLSGGYAELLGDKRTVRLPNLELDVRLSQALNERGFVGKIKPEKDHIMVYTKRVGRL